MPKCFISVLKEIEQMVNSPIGLTLIFGAILQGRFQRGVEIFCNMGSDYC